MTFVVFWFLLAPQIINNIAVKVPQRVAEADPVRMVTVAGAAEGAEE